MRGWPNGCVDAVVTDPPYVGFGFTPQNYLEMMEPFAEEILRCVGPSGRLAVSQPKARLSTVRQMFDAGSVAEIKDAFSDHRGDSAFFLLRNPIPDRNPQVRQWSNIPGTIHPNPRDVNKMAALVELMSEPGDLILDPFCGSGATGLAAVLLGRNVVGIELGEERALDANRRFEAIGAEPLSDVDWRRGRDSNPR